MSRDSYLDHLAAVPLFAACSKKDLQRIARASDEVSIEAGRAIIQEGAAGHEAYVILEGTASVERKGIVLADLGPGDYFGELALFDGGPRTATVLATTDMELLVLGQREFAGVIEDVPGLANRLLASLANIVRKLNEQAFD